MILENLPCDPFPHAAFGMNIRGSSGKDDVGKAPCWRRESFSGSRPHDRNVKHFKNMKVLNDNSWYSDSLTPIHLSLFIYYSAISLHGAEQRYFVRTCPAAASVPG